MKGSPGTNQKGVASRGPQRPYTTHCKVMSIRPTHLCHEGRQLWQQGAGRQVAGGHAQDDQGQCLGLQGLGPPTTGGRDEGGAALG